MHVSLGEPSSMPRAPPANRHAEAGFGSPPLTRVCVLCVCARVARPICGLQCVARGGNLIKFVLGKRRRHERFVRVEGTGASAHVVWGAHRARLLRVDANVGASLQREQRLSADEVSRAFFVVCESKVLALMAASMHEKTQWVDGFTAVAQGLLPSGGSASAAR